MRFMALAALTIGAVSVAAPAQAQTYSPDYPVCLHVYGRATYYECRYTSIAQISPLRAGPLNAK